MLRAEKVSLNSQVQGGSFPWKTYTIERDRYKQIKLAKNIYGTNQNFSLKQRGNKETSKLPQFYLIYYLPKKKKKQLQ